MTLHPAITQRHVSATLASLLLLLLQSIPLYAQNHDIRLSDDPFQPLLTTEARIQSAASIGSVTLAVWGSTASEGDSVRPLLYGQFLYDHEPLNIPFIITSTAARPSKFVQVVALDDRFLVVWNDRRGASPVTWLTRIDKFGAITAEERLVDSGTIAAAGVFTAPIDGGYLLYWDIDKPDSLRTWVRGLNRDGNFSGTAIATTFPPIQRMVHSPAGSDSLYFDCGNDGIYQIDRTGGWNRITLPNNGVVSIGPDGSMVAVLGDQIGVYRSVLEKTPYRYIPVSTPLHTLPSNTLPGTVLAFYDPLGRIGRSYSVLEVIQVANISYSKVSTFISYIDSDGNYGPAKYLGYHWDQTWPHYVYGILSYPEPAIATRYCANSIYLHIVIHYTYSYEYQGNRGRESSLGDIRVFVTHNNFSFLRGKVTDCLLGTITTPYAVRDTTDPSQSNIIVVWADDSARLISPVAEIHKNLPERSPIITATNSGFAVAFVQKGIDSTLMLRRWDAASTGSVGSIATVNTTLQKISDSITARTTVQLSTTGTDYLATIHTDSINKAGRVIGQNDRLVQPTDSGWRDIYAFDLGDLGSPYGIQKSMVDPDDGTILLTIGYPGVSGTVGALSVAQLDQTGDTLVDLLVRTAPTSNRGIVAVPLMDNYFYLLDNARMFRYQDSMALDSNTSAISADRRYIPLPGYTYAQWYVSSVAFFFEIFDPTLQRQRQFTFPTAIDGVSNVTVVQNHLDSGFAIVYGKNDGLHLTVIDKNLKLVKSDTIISESRDTTRHPSAVYVGDTLTVVWESYRKGVIDIYGTSRVVPAHIPPASREASPTSSQHISRLRPNPASDRILVDLTMPPPSGATWQILDATGGSIMRGDILAGSTHLDIATATLPSGYYLLSLEIAGERNVQGFVVQR